jgi:hypothetical protein
MKTLAEMAERYDVADTISEEPAYIFRGHADARWTLQPTFHRSATDDGRKPGLEASQLLALEAYLTGRFKAHALGYLDGATLKHIGDGTGYWVAMRHHGVPTRLIDWTTSFYVALYFACVGAQDCDGAVYVVHTGTLNRAMAQEHPTHFSNTDMRSRLDPDAPRLVEILSRAAAWPERMVAQQGIFTLCRNVAGDTEDILARLIPIAAMPGKENMRKWLIPANMKPSVLRHLRMMNVTAQSLFPGLDGIGRHLDTMVRIRQ